MNIKSIGGADKDNNIKRNNKVKNNNNTAAGINIIENII